LAAATTGEGFRLAIKVSAAHHEGVGSSNALLRQQREWLGRQIARSCAMASKLSRLTLCGFKSIRELRDFEMGPINLLIGENGAGKSNFVSFFRFLSWMLGSPRMQHFIAEGGFGSSFLYDGPEKTQQIEAHLVFLSDTGTNEYAFRLFHVAPDTLAFAEEKYRYTPTDWSGKRDWLLLGEAHAESKLDQEADDGHEAARFILRFLNRIQVYQFHNTSKTARIRQGFSVTDNGYLKEDGANLAPVLLRLREQKPTYYRRIVERIRQVTPFFDDFVLEPSGNKLLLQWRERDSDLVFGPHQASDGSLRMMALFTLLQLPEENLPDVIVLDEPELGLHPAAVNSLAGLLHAVSHHKQVIVATQSMNLLNYFRPEDIVVIERPDGASTLRRLESEELAGWLEEYSMSELWEKNVIGGMPR
jgi:predicted ATPase